MPIYNFYCECGEENEIFLKSIIDDGYEEICSCGTKMEQEIFPPIGFKHDEKGVLVAPPKFNSDNEEWNFRRKKKR